MKRFLSYPLSVLHYLFFGLMITVFHPIQWFTLKVFGYTAHKKSVDYLNLTLIWSLYLLGTRVKYIKKYPIPEGVPLVIVSNHQSSHDVSPISYQRFGFTLTDGY